MDSDVGEVYFNACPHLVEIIEAQGHLCAAVGSAPDRIALVDEVGRAAGRWTEDFTELRRHFLEIHEAPASLTDDNVKIGRASCRERVVSTCRSRWSPYH